MGVSLQDSADTNVVTRSSEKRKRLPALLGRLVRWLGRLVRWRPDKTREDAELKKLRAYIEVVRQQAKIFALSKETGCASDAERQLVGEVLNEEERGWGEDEDSGHEYADRLNQLLPLVADDEYLYTVLQFELEGGPPWEDIKLSALLDREALHRLKTDSTSLRRSPQDNEAERGRREIAESLRLLYRARDDQRRHLRLVSKLRRHHLRMWGALLVVLLVVLIVTILGASVRDMGREQLFLVATAGALGSSLAATFRLRDVAELNAFRALAEITFIQPIIGASLGLLTGLLLNVNAFTIKGLDNSAWQTMGILAFASGFSEPFFLGTIAKVLGTDGGRGEYGGSPRGTR